MPTTTDRAAAVRRAMCSVVADRGLHDASMATVAAAAGVATGTAYVHYPSKEDLILATYVEVKHTLGRAATADIDAGLSVAEQFAQLWRGVYDHLSTHPDQARFLLQIDSSPLAGPAHEQAMASDDDPLSAVVAAPDMAEQLVDLPPAVLYDLAIGPVVRLVAAGVELADDELDTLCGACWRAVTG